MMAKVTYPESVKSDVSQKLQMMDAIVAASDSLLEEHSFIPGGNKKSDSVRHSLTDQWDAISKMIWAIVESK